MQSFPTQLFILLATGFCLICCGCPSPTPNGSDPEVWHDTSIEGSAEIMSVNSVATDGTEIDIQFTFPDGRVDEKQVEGLSLATIEGLPDGYKPKVGDRMRLRLDLHYKRKNSVGPPDFVHGNVDSRKYICLSVEAESVNQKADIDKADEDDETVGQKNGEETKVDFLGAMKDSEPPLVPEREMEDEPSSSPYEIEKLIWSTTGGGQILFTFTPNDNKFEVTVDNYSFRDFETPLTLDLDSDNVKTYAVVKSIFTGKRDLQKDTFTPGGPTGTWTTITLVDAKDKRTEIRNISTSGDLHEVYVFVANAARKALDE